MTTIKDDAQIHALIEDWAKALRAKDVDAVMSAYAPDLLAFDLPPPLQVRGASEHRAGFEAWFPTFVGPIGFEMRELSVAADANLAFSHSLNRITGQRTSGESTDVWVRATVAFRKIGGRWRVVHEHVSVPFYMDGSNRAAVDLKP